ncbi:hypothetical protein [Streptomyces sp. NRRL S-455]|uniref:hypothetical protein n=1 Tax=Streptomyces sp. NRRL S-455 TaxID=1463908 RepID=UPI000AFC96C9|nr:hypothetical protein [Streptomyces sp. NRRL S-455]
MDCPSRSRLKILGRARTAGVDRWPEAAGDVLPGGYRANVERIVLVQVEAYDWDCAQHIEPRYTAAELDDALKPVRQRIAHLEQENARL